MLQNIVLVLMIVLATVWTFSVNYRLDRLEKRSRKNEA